MLNIVEPRAIVLAAIFTSCGPNSDTVVILIHLALVVIFTTTHFHLPLALLKLVLLPKQVKVRQETQIDVRCHHHRVLLEGLELLDNFWY